MLSNREHILIAVRSLYIGVCKAVHDLLPFDSHMQKVLEKNQFANLNSMLDVIDPAIFALLESYGIEANINEFKVFDVIDKFSESVAFAVMATWKDVAKTREKLIKAKGQYNVAFADIWPNPIAHAEHFVNELAKRLICDKDLELEEVCAC